MCWICGYASLSTLDRRLDLRTFFVVIHVTGVGIAVILDASVLRDHRHAKPIFLCVIGNMIHV